MSKRSILMIEGDHDVIMLIRRIVNDGSVQTRNMIWTEGRTPRFSGGVGYADLEAILDAVMVAAQRAMETNDD